MSSIVMVDLETQHLRIKEELESAVLKCLNSGAYIKGPEVAAFEEEFAEYLGVSNVIGCGNGTDALQIALMTLNLNPGDEVIVPAFTYVATAEVIALLGLNPVMVDVDPNTFCIDVSAVERAVTKRTRAIVPVHLFGQSADMDALGDLASRHNLYLIEDAAQAIGTDYTNRHGITKKAGTMSTIGCTSFFPTKNLGCCGDGGALMIPDDELANRARMIANHGQTKKYYHGVVGVNSRLDAMQAAILRVKLRHLDSYVKARQAAAAFYDKHLASLEGIEIPYRDPQSSHTFHQYTLKVKGQRDELQKHLTDLGVPSVVYYPLPLHRQEAFRVYETPYGLPHTEALCQKVLSLPMHSELDQPTLTRIASAVTEFEAKGML